MWILFAREAFRRGLGYNLFPQKIIFQIVSEDGRFGELPFDLPLETSNFLFQEE
jgi:hypothetical protein